MVSSADRVAASSGRTSAAAALARACVAVRAPGITTLTPGWSMTQRSASCAVVTPGGVSAATSRAEATPTSKGTPAKVSPTSKASPERLYVRWSCLLYTSDAADEEDSVDLG